MFYRFNLIIFVLLFVNAGGEPSNRNPTDADYRAAQQLFDIAQRALDSTLSR